MVLLEVNGLSKALGGNDVVQNVSFVQEVSQKIAIAGEAGSGKTTLLRMIGGLLQPNGGEALLLNERVKGPDEVLIAGHKQIAYLSQHFELRNNYHVHEVLDMACKVPAEAAMKIFDICKITHLLHRWTDELSGGEKQRIALAKLLVTSPSLLLLDEPFSNLDAGNKRMIQDVLHDISNKIKMTCLMVSHDATDILSWADLVIVMKNGIIVQQDTPQNLYLKPKDNYCAALFGYVNLINKRSVLFDEALQHTNCFVRPEHIAIAPADGNLVNGRVTRKKFMGNFFILEVMVGDQEILVQVTSDAHAVESLVNLTIAPEYFNIFQP